MFVALGGSTAEGTRQIIEAVFDAVKIVNEQLPPGQRLKQSLDTVLAGEHGMLDSLGLVNLIVEVERCVERRCGASVILTDDETISGQETVFATVQTLADHIERVLARRGYG